MSKEVTNMRTGILPKSYLGKGSVILATANILLNAVFMVLVARGDLGPGTVPLWTGGVTGILAMAAFAAGVIGIIWSKERAILVYLGMALLVLLFVLGEILFPH